MTVHRPKGAKGKADRLASQLARSKGYCECCGDQDYEKLQAAHVIPRRYAATRTDPANLKALCWTCHRRFTDWPCVWMSFVDEHIGRPEYDRLKAKALAGVKATESYWRDEVERLKLLREAADV